ncbi:hypothetical protein LP083-1_022 [Listeria phage LP-083-1]|uniref:TM2 domain-containing protein n=1 Tax=Listeria phage LP-083-1 TaxID=1458854 RepID=A0A059T6N7_9CAUD|nr:hypothetical protein LP083-1_022 [Listeria phage LP-083-1]
MTKTNYVLDQLTPEERQLVEQSTQLKSTTVAFWLNLLGSFACDFYTGRILAGVIKVLLSIASSGIGAVIFTIWGLFTYRSRVRKYNNQLLTDKAFMVNLSKPTSKGVEK